MLQRCGESILVTIHYILFYVRGKLHPGNVTCYMGYFYIDAQIPTSPWLFIIVSHRRVIWELQWPCQLNGGSLLCQTPQLTSPLYLNPTSVSSSITRIIRVQRPGGRGYRHPE